ncbi:hypothetical protein FACHB389_31980 [Nostoc calcicola FACHB-389]|nr:hypothetical protein FACHB389_31980 [Nostoc calcicola FACHB-389]
MGNGEWGMGNGEWGMRNEEWGIGHWALVIPPISPISLIPLISPLPTPLNTIRTKTEDFPTKKI